MHLPGLLLSTLLLRTIPSTMNLLRVRDLLVRLFSPGPLSAYHQPHATSRAWEGWAGEREKGLKPFEPRLLSKSWPLRAWPLLFAKGRCPPVNFLGHPLFHAAAVFHNPSVDTRFLTAC